MQPRRGFVREDNVSCAAPLPWKSLALEVQPRGYVILVLRWGLSHSEDSASHALQVAGVDEASDIVAS
jgi:hypothetical protein